MAQLYSVRTGIVALSASSTKSLVLLNPAGHKAVIAAISFSLDGVAAAPAVALEMYRVTSLGSPAGTTTTAQPVNSNDDAAGTTSLTTLTTEPTTVLVLDDWYVQPFGGLCLVQYPLGREPFGVAGGQRVGWRYVSGTSPGNARMTVWIEE